MSLRPLFRRLDPVVAWLRAACFRLHGAEIGPRCRFGRGVRLDAAGGGRLRIGPKSRFECLVQVRCFGGVVDIGSHVHLGEFVTVYGHGGVVIGDNTLVGSHSSIIAANHSVPAPGSLVREAPDVPLPVRIGRDVWIGAGVRVLGGVTIGDGCVVGAGAVVTHDIPPNSVAVGVPARVVRQRQ